MKRALLLCGFVGVVGCLPPLVSSSSGSTTSAEGPCSGSDKCCDEHVCYCLQYCPTCDHNNFRRCGNFGNGPECFCQQGPTGTTGGVSGSSGHAASSAGSGSGSFGSSGAGTSSAGSSFSAASSSGGMVSSSASSGSTAASSTASSSTSTGTTGLCSRLATPCDQDSDCCSTFCEGTCVACPGGGQCGTTGTTGVQNP